MPPKREEKISGISSRICAAIEERAGGNLASFAREAEIPETTLRGLLKDDPVPKLNTAAAICRVARRPLEWLLGGEVVPEAGEAASIIAEAEEAYRPALLAAVRAVASSLPAKARDSTEDDGTEGGTLRDGATMEYGTGRAAG